MINGKMLVGEIRRLAEESPDHIYRPEFCRYVNHQDKTGSCLVGQALVNLGADPDWFLDNHNPEDGSPANSATFQEIAHMIPGVEVSEHTKNWVNYVQSGQDSRMHWAKAVEAADAEWGSIE